MKLIRNILYIITLLSVPTTIVLGILLTNPFIYVITVILIGITSLVHYKYIQRIKSDVWEVVDKEELTNEEETDLLLSAFRDKDISEAKESDV